MFGFNYPCPWTRQLDLPVDPPPLPLLPEPLFVDPPLDPLLDPASEPPLLPLEAPSRAAAAVRCRAEHETDEEDSGGVRLPPGTAGTTRVTVVRLGRMPARTASI